MYPFFFVSRSLFIYLSISSVYVYLPSFPLSFSFHFSILSASSLLFLLDIARASSRPTVPSHSVLDGLTTSIFDPSIKHGFLWLTWNDKAFIFGLILSFRLGHHIPPAVFSLPHVCCQIAHPHDGRLPWDTGMKTPPPYCPISESPHNTDMSSPVQINVLMQAY